MGSPGGEDELAGDESTRDRPRTHRSKDSRKDEKKSKKRSKKDVSRDPAGEHKKRSSKERKTKRSKQLRAGARSSDSSSASSGSDDAGILSPHQQLQRERQAADVLRDLLWKHSAARKELRQLLWTVDQGKAADLRGVPDQDLRASLERLFKLLGMKRAGSKGSYALPANAPSPTLAVLGFVFEEAPRPPPRPPPPIAVPARERAAPRPAPTAPSHATAPVQPHADAEAGAQAVRSLAPAPPPGGTSSPDPCVSPGPVVAARRVVGPAVPSREALEAAAAAAAALQAEEAAEARRQAELGDDATTLEALVGPIPPEDLLEADAVPQDAREAEVVRIIRFLRSAAAEAADSKRAGSADAPGAPPRHITLHAYDVLSVATDATASDIKKRYMRLSLLIHPDKCSHKDAHEAFQAVAQAAKALQDPGQRAAVDAAREDAELRKAAAAAAAAIERDRQWQSARGQAPMAGFEELSAVASAGAARPSREGWMTELPPERSALFGGGPMSQVSQRAFSKTGPSVRGDTSVWTDTPEQREARAAGRLPAAAAGPLLIAGSGGGGISSEDAELMRAYDSKVRKKSLLELHTEQQQKNAVKKAKVEPGPSAAPSGHPWRPFDRDKDLALKPKSLDPSALLKAQPGLGSKFSSSGASRKFL